MRAVRRTAEWLKSVHRNERGSMSLETLMYLAAVALPVLIFLIKYGWPKILAFFDKGLSDLEKATDQAVDSW